MTKWGLGTETSKSFILMESRCLHCPGMTATDIIATTKENLLFGTSLYSDLNNNIDIIDMGPIDGSQNTRIAMRGSASVALGFGSEVVLYS